MALDPPFLSLLRRLGDQMNDKLIQLNAPLLGRLGEYLQPLLATIFLY